MRALCVSLVAVMVIACGGDGGGTGPGTGTTPVFTSLGLTPANPALFQGDQVTLVVTPRDQNNNPISVTGAPTFQSSAMNVATVSTGGVVSAVGAGSSTITASLTANGVTRTATAAVNVTAVTATATVNMGQSNVFIPERVAITRNGTVTWVFPAVVHNVVFTPKPGAPANIGNMSNSSVPRTFGTVDEYPYTCTIHPGMNGTVVVR